MKNKELLKKRLLAAMTGISLAVMMAFSVNTTALASEAPAEETETTEEIQPRKAIIDWRFKVEDGKLYRRLYNYTEQCWVGDWILCV